MVGARRKSGEEKLSPTPTNCPWVSEMSGPRVSSNLIFTPSLQSAFYPQSRGGEWYPENRGSRKFLIGSRNLGDFCDESRSLVFHLFLSVSESRIFFARSRSLGFASLAEILRQKLSCWASRVSVAEILALRRRFIHPERMLIWSSFRCTVKALQTHKQMHMQNM